MSEILHITCTKINVNTLHNLKFIQMQSNSHISEITGGILSKLAYEFLSMPRCVRPKTILFRQQIWPNSSPVPDLETLLEANLNFQVWLTIKLACGIFSRLRQLNVEIQRQ